MKEEKEEENLYILEDEDENDTWGINYAQSDHYDIEDLESKENKNETEDFLIKENKAIEKKEKHVLAIMFLILFSPIEGWKALRRSKCSIERAQSDCFYPLLALLSLSCFIDLVYYPYIELTQIIVNAIIVFTSYFFGYFSILVLLKIVLPSYCRERIDTKFGKLFILMSMSTLIFFRIFVIMLPMIWAILIFLPLWTVYVMFRGIKFFNLPERGILRFTFFVCGAVLVIPYGIDYLLTLFIPV